MEPPVPPSPEDIREELSAICAHKRFARSDRVCHFLQFIVEQRLRGNSVNEQLIGVKVFGRKAGYDSGNDTIVRTQAVDLRRRLEDYYEENPNARVRISVPRGGYNPTFVWVDGNRSEHSSGSSAALPGNSQTAPEISEEQAITLPEPLGLRADTWFARRWAILLAGSLLLAAVAAGLFFARLRKPAHLTTRNTIVLADFVNTTGEDIFDGTLKHALTVQLTQSPFLNVLSDAKIAATLKLMNRPMNERLTLQVAREICQRTNSKALVEGSISTSGTDYVIALKALNCETGGTLASVQAHAPNLDSVLAKLQQTGNELREKLGESLASINKFDTPLVQATTSSLEALKALSEGFRLVKEKGDVEAIPYYKRAIDLDPNFAEAYANLGTIYRNLKQDSLADANLQKAFELRDRVTERERLFIEGVYYGAVTGDLEKAIRVYTQWARVYPAVDTPHVNLGAYYGILGQYDKAAAESLEALRRTPRDITSYGNLMGCYVSLGRLDEANAIYAQAKARKLDTAFLRQIKYLAAFLEGNEAVMREQIAWAMGKPGVEDIFLWAQSDTEAYYGRLRKARELSAQAADSAERNDARETAAVYYLDAAFREAEFGNAARARQDIKKALDLSVGRDIKLVAALALSRAGDYKQPQNIVNELDQQFPTDTMLQGYWLPSIRAALELHRGNPQRAIELLKTTSAYELGTPWQFPIATMYPVYIRGLAYLKAGQPRLASTQFRKILEHRSLLQNFPLGALAHVQLARALAASDDTAGARKEYQDFFALWKDADPDIPILQQAKQEYAKLQSR